MADKMTVKEALAYCAAKKEVSAGDIKKKDGKKEPKFIYPQWKEGKIEDILAENRDYRDWQNEKYGSKVSFPDWVHSIVTKGSDIPKIDNERWFNRSYRLVDPDLNYNRTRMSQD